MIERLVPDTVVVVSTREDLTGVQLFAEEERYVAHAVERRRREFETGRGCARKALGELGLPPVPVVNGERGEPIWPRGIVGSITHCVGYRACAVALSDHVRAIGIDAEAHEPLRDGVLKEVAFGNERNMVAGSSTGVCLDKVLFAAKEAIYKAWYPLAKCWLGFEDVELRIDTAARRFHARLLISGPVLDGWRLTEFHGRWGVDAGIVAAATVILSRPCEPLVCGEGGTDRRSGSRRASR